MEIINIDKLADPEYNKGVNPRLVKWAKYLGAKTWKEREALAEGDEIFMEVNDIIRDLMENHELDDMFNRDEYIKAVYTEEGESSKSKDIAINMLNMNMDIDDISKATGLSIEEIENLKKES